MTEKDIKKSLSLKSHKNTGTKQSKATSGSKNVTIQVRRKKIIKPDSLVKEASSAPVSSEIKIKKETETLKKNKINTEVSKPKPQNKNLDQLTSKKKSKIDKDEKMDKFDNKELHLKEPKPKKHT